MKKNFQFLAVIVFIAFALTGCKEDPVLPTAGFTYEPAAVLQFGEVVFTNTSVDANTYAWSFGDGGTSTEMNPSHTFETAGTFDVTLVASNEDGEGEITQSIVVTEVTLPVAGFTYEPMEVTRYDSVKFTNTSTDADSYAWDFGDDNTSTEMDPVHVFTAAGTYDVTLVATNADGENQTTQSIVVAELNSTYTINDTVYSVHADSAMFWYQSSMGGDPYIRLLTPVDGQDNPDLLKLYPNKGILELAGTYTWEAKPTMGSNPVGTYDVGYTADYAGMSYAWTSIGKTGSGDLVFTEIYEDVYKVEGQMILSIGSFDWETGNFIETSTADLTIDYVGAVTPL